jgi:3-oxoadipate enol-lactonase
VFRAHRGKWPPWGCQSGCLAEAALAARAADAHLQGARIERSGVLQRADVRLRYSCQGTGPALLFVHALGTDSTLWAAQVSALADSHICVTYDLPGHGLSTAGSPSRYSFEGLADDAAALLIELGITRASVIGTSIGGEIAQMLAARHPEVVEDLILCSTACYTDGTRVGVWEERIAAVRTHGMASLAVATVNRWFTPAFRTTQPHLVEEYAERMARLAPDTYVAFVHAIQALDLRPLIRRLTCRSLIVCGSEDGATGPHVAREIVNHLPSAHFQIMAGIGHLPNLEAPGAFLCLLRAFLARAAPSDRSDLSGR